MWLQTLLWPTAVCMLAVLAVAQPPPGSNIVTEDNILDSWVRSSGTNSVEANNRLADQLVDMIRSAGENARFSRAGIRTCIDAGVPSKVIAAMLDRTRMIALPPPPGPPPYPPDPGCYYLPKEGRAWLALHEQQVTWSDKGALMSLRKVASLGTLKRDKRGTVLHESSRSSVPPNAVIGCSFPAGTNLDDYQLMPLGAHKGTRVARVGSGKREEAARRSVPFKMEQNGKGQIRIPTADLDAGEYGFYNHRPVAGSKSYTGKMYTFEIPGNGN